MNLTLVLILVALCAALMAFERRGLKTTLALAMKGDVKRETRWLAQYGQAVCTGTAALLVFQLDPRPLRVRAALTVIAATAIASLAATLVKRLVSRVRPGHENAGKFLGPSWKHANYRESFPSSHSASAVALSVVLASLYPNAQVTFWALALTCAALRYIMDAHWPSDVLGGIAVGYVVAHLALDVAKLG
ncbi:MAG TPA: phosphatase PAP2 family protein [Tepidisphaeraceae bacterium]|nr:phosphatase PAP2 family protein [Tepidisphaeraceae bacterium]